MYKRSHPHSKGQTVLNEFYNHIARDHYCVLTCTTTSLGSATSVRTYTSICWRSLLHRLEFVVVYDNAAEISQTTSSNAFSWMKTFVILIRISISQHWFRKRLGAEQATSQGLVYWHIYASLGLNELFTMFWGKWLEIVVKYTCICEDKPSELTSVYIYMEVTKDHQLR